MWLPHFLWDVSSEIYKKKKNMVETRSKVFIVLLTISYIVWGASTSLTPPFYPEEAEKKGATPSQV